ncbi:hypothetical protein COCCADRAFT_35604 [Bipolaris zeicola 26-R-13]|uniref:Uncharacterized protein n=1 Tax=Cochliobolus carbonum (strain 26-R-13) TaxID=930089 RepID=W6Y9Y7_COCC2|nr:uncharacterized protein COCCADRAFT_35604 [Bipolaris zeicola 26-R-13]EUC34783.1 hypothetical protein COCCADRAFT_35604 [Bipolaris zeicola 26-R-13]
MVSEHELNPQEETDFRDVLDEPEDIRDLRSDVNVNIDLLATLTGRLTRDNTFKLVRYQEDKEQQAILDWLTPTDYTPQQNDFLKQWQAGSGKWLLDSAKFKSWLGIKKQTLFCPGIPGAGKTILTSIVVDELSSHFKDESNNGIAYIYCNFKRQDEQTLEDLLASVLKQLAQARSSLPQTVRSLYDKHRSMKARPSIDDISVALHSVVAEFSRVFILVDALDECRVNDSCRAKLLSQLSQLQTSCGANLFATSRFIPDITKTFERDTWLEIRASKHDIQRYVEGHIDELPGFVRRDLDLQQEINFTNCNRFLLAKLHLNSLKGKRSRTAIRDALRTLPTGTESYSCAYSDAMARIEGQLPDEAMLAKEALSWITCAKRPLTTIELQHALAVEDGQEEFDEDNKSDIEDIVSVCAGLVTVDEESGIIRLVHYTTQEYFERTQKDWFPTAEFDITMICVTYLSFAVFGSGSCHTDSSFEERLQLNPLYDYAAHYWGYHARQARSAHPKVIEFFHHETNMEAASQAMQVRKKFSWDDRYSQSFTRRMTGLHICAYFGITDVAAAIIDFADLESRDEYGWTPLFWAAENGHEGVEADLEDRYGNTPLWWAARNGHEGSVKLLLDTGKVKIDWKDTYVQRMLWRTARSGQEGVAKLLLDVSKAEVNWENDRQMLLSLAIKRGREGAVKLLQSACAS